MIAETQLDHIHSKATPHVIAKLLTERQETLVLFNRLAEMKPFTTVESVRPLLQRFCQILVDYVALGHFEVYQCLEEHASDSAHCRRVKRLARALYPQIALTTQIAIAFNDHYDGQEHCNALDSLCEDLSRLGEHLATRIELEDRLIAATKQPLRAVLQ